MVGLLFVRQRATLQGMQNAAGEAPPTASPPPAPCTPRSLRLLPHTSHQLVTLLPHTSHQLVTLLPHTSHQLVTLLPPPKVLWRSQLLPLPPFLPLVGAIFFSLCLFGFTALSSVDSLLRDRVLVAREAHEGFYPSAAYLVPRLVRRRQLRPLSCQLT